MRLAYRPDGARLAAAVCFGNRVVELQPPGYGEVASPVAAACPWALGYSPDTLSLATTFRSGPPRPARCSVTSGSAGRSRSTVTWDVRCRRWRIVRAGRSSPSPLRRGSPCSRRRRAIPRCHASGVTAEPRLHHRRRPAPGGDASGLQVRCGGELCAPLRGQRRGDRLAVAGYGGWIAIVRDSTVSVRRASDLAEVSSSPAPWVHRRRFLAGRRAARGGGESDQVRRFRAGGWQELSPIAVTGRVDAIAFRPRGWHAPARAVRPRPHRRLRRLVRAAGDTSLAAALAPTRTCGSTRSTWTCPSTGAARTSGGASPRTRRTSWP